MTDLKEYDPSINNTRPSTAFINLATYGELESALYGGKKAITYFVRETTRCTWFTQIPIRMRLNTANPTFNQRFRATISRSGDYLLNAWLRVTLNKLCAYLPTSNYTNSDGNGCETLVWTPNFMHNLIEECSLKVNGMVIDELFSEHLDFYSAFMIPKRSRVGYNRMIGNFTSPNNGLAGINICGTDVITRPYVNFEQQLFLPLPFFFSKDSTMALPTASLPYADLKIDFKLRDWRNLLASIGTDGIPRNIEILQLTSQTPALSNVQVWGNYAIVSNKERQAMGCNSRDILIEQNQQVGGSFGSGKLNVTNQNSTTSVDLRLNGAIKALFFAARNQLGTSGLPFRSVYSTTIPSACDVWGVKISASGNDSGLNAFSLDVSQTAKPPPNSINLNSYNNSVNDKGSLSWGINGVSPIGSIRLLYENTIRLSMESLYYSLIQPYYHGRNVPDSGNQHGVVSMRDPTEIAGQAALGVGYHMYSYALKTSRIDPNGSTNYSKLKNATLVFTPSNSAINQGVAGKGPWFIFISAINNNILRIKDGSMGFPIL